MTENQKKYIVSAFALIAAGLLLVATGIVGIIVGEGDEELLRGQP